MAFGWSFPKLMVILTLGFFLFGVPLMTWAMVWRDRRRRAAAAGRGDPGPRPAGTGAGGTVPRGPS